MPTLTPEAPVARALPPQPEKPAPLPAEPATPDDSPWFLDKSSWRFHRRFYAVFRRPMQRGEYSHLLRQVRSGHAEHLGENCWRVTLPDRRTTLPVRASKWTLITILPKNWQPTASAVPRSPTTGGLPMSDRVAPVNAIEDADTPCAKAERVTSG